VRREGERKQKIADLTEEFKVEEENEERNSIEKV
jgi:hypothetical protein